MIYLIDRIGKESGIHLYDDTFYRAFNKIGQEVVTLSNFENETSIKLFSNFYRGNKLIRMINLASGLRNILLFAKKHKGDIFIYQSFGLRKIDQIFIKLLAKKVNLIVLTHDIFDIRDQDNESQRNKKIKFYRDEVPAIMTHSEKIRQQLIDMGVNKRIIYFPHFCYDFNKDYNKDNLSKEVASAYEMGKVNFLFFGQVRKSKGIDWIVDAVNILQKQNVKNINVVIAGIDKDNLVSDLELPSFVKRICKYISDEELNFFYSNADYVLIPYKEIFQSGVMETSIYFRTPAVVSNIDYFRKLQHDYPSFTKMMDKNDGQSLADAMIEVANSTNQVFYKESDLDAYYKAHDPHILLKELVK